MSYNYKEAYVCYVDTDPQTAFAAGEVAKANAKLIGICRQESGFKLNKDEQEKTSTSEDRVLSYKCEIDVQALTALGETVRGAIDGKKVSLLFVDAEGVYVPDDAVNLGSVGVVLPASPIGVMTCPMPLFIEEDEKYGTGKVQPIMITGSLTKPTKDELRKTIDILVA